MVLEPAKILCPRGSPGKNAGVGSRALLQGIFLTQGLNPSLLHWQPDSLSLSHLERPNLCVQTTVINSFTYADDTTLMAESEEELKSLLMKVKEESETIGLNLSIQKTKIVALSLLYGPTLTSIHDYWKKRIFNYVDLCQQSDVSAF